MQEHVFFMTAFLPLETWAALRLVELRHATEAYTYDPTLSSMLLLSNQESLVLDDEDVQRPHPKTPVRGEKDTESKSRKGSRSGGHIDISSRLINNGIMPEEISLLREKMLQIDPGSTKHNKKPNDSITIQRLEHLLAHHSGLLSSTLCQKLRAYQSQHFRYHKKVHHPSEEQEKFRLQREHSPYKKYHEPSTEITQCELCKVGKDSALGIF